jgi:hypothetical protein
LSTFEQLLTEDESSVGKLLGPMGDQGGGEAQLGVIARSLNLNRIQLLCAIGFNRRAPVMNSVIAALGFNSYDELCSRRNFLFIDDIYDQLSINDVLAIYQNLAGREDADDALHDLIYSRIAEIERRVEASRNPVLIGSYKLEIRGIYQAGVVDKAFVEQRLGSQYTALRALTNEIDLIAKYGSLTMESLIARPSVSPEEKRLMLQQDLVPASLIRARLRHPRISPREKSVLDAALTELN